MEDHAFGVIDVNFLSHLATVKGQGVSSALTLGVVSCWVCGLIEDASMQVDPSRDRAKEKELALHVWDNIVGYVRLHLLLHSRAERT